MIWQPFFLTTTNAVLYCAAITPPHTPSEILILINGYQRPHSDFQSFVRGLHALHPHVVVASLDNRGIGQTTENQLALESPLSISIMAQDVLDLIHELQARYASADHPLPVSLLGISLGGMIAQKVAVQLSGISPVRRLFLVSTTSDAQLRPLHHAAEPYKTKNFEDYKQHMRLYFGQSFLSSNPVFFDTICKNMFSSTQNKTDDLGPKRQFLAAKNFIFTPQLAYLITEKTLIIVGDEDQVTPVACSQLLADNIANSQLMILEKGIGHLLLLEAPKPFLHIVSTELMQSF